MDLQDALRSCQWRVDLSVEKLKADMQSINQAEKKTSFLPKKKSKSTYNYYLGAPKTSSKTQTA